MTEEEIYQLLSNLPSWASEETLDSIASINPASYNQAIQAMRKLGVQLDPMETKRSSDKLKKEVSKTLKAVKQGEKAVSETLRTFDRDLDPLDSIISMQKIAADAVDGVAGAVSDLAGNVPALGKMAQGVLSGARLGMAAAVGATAFFAKVLTEQEKSMRAMIDLGLVPEDLRIYDTIRQQAALTGMSFGELTAQFAQYKDMLVNTGGDFSRNAREVSQVIANVQSNSRVLGDMGYTTEQLSARFLEEADLLYKLGQIESVNTVTQRRINENLRSSSEMATVMASLTGDSREAMLAARSEALKDVNFRLALHQNEAFLIENFGEGSVDRITEAQSIIKTAFESAVPGIGDLVADLLPNTVRNIQYDRTSVNDASDELKNILKFLPGDVQRQFFDIFDRAAVGDITDNEIVAAVGTIAQGFSTAPTTFSNSADAVKFREMQATATLSLTSIKDATVESIQAQRAMVGTNAELADDSVDAIDEARIAFRTTVDTISPGFQTTSTALGAFGGTVDTLGRVISYVFPQMASYEEQLRRQQAQYEQDEESDNNAAEFYSNPQAYQSYMPGYQPPGSPDSLGLTPEMWDYTNPNRVPPPPPSADELLYQDLQRRQNNGMELTDDESATLSRLQQERQTGSVAPSSGVDLSGVTVNSAMNPLFSMDGASRMTRNSAPDQMQDVLSGPYAELQRIFGAPVPINDAIAKAGTSRETKTPGSQHFHGKALDLSIRGMNDAEKMRLFNSAMEAGFTSFGFGQNIMHVDTRDSRASWTYGSLSTFGGVSTDLLKSRVAGGAYTPVQPRPQTQTAPTTESSNDAEIQAELERIQQAEAAAAEAARRTREALESEAAAGGGGK